MAINPILDSGSAKKILPMWKSGGPTYPAYPTWEKTLSPAKWLVHSQHAAEQSVPLSHAFSMESQREDWQHPLQVP